MKAPTNYQKHLTHNPIQKILIENFYTTLFEVIKPLKLTSVLDVGCGEGFTLKKLEEKKIGKANEGIDYMVAAVKIANKIYPNLKIKKGNIYSLPYEEKTFDLVLCTEVLEHLDDPEKALREIQRVSKKYVLFSVPNEPFFILANLFRGKYLKSWGNHPEHINHWTAFGFAQFLKKNGFKIIKQRHPFAWTLILASK